MTNESNFPKFRAWHIANKTMHDVAVIDCTNGNLVLKEGYRAIEYDDPPVVCHHWSRGDEIILMQSTSIFDDENKEIFEGDILEFPKDEDEAYGDRGYIGRESDNRFDFFPIGEPTCSDQWRDFYRIQNAIIIGNIHTHPELLQGDRE